MIYNPETNHHDDFPGDLDLVTEAINQARTDDPQVADEMEAIKNTIVLNLKTRK